MDGLEVAAALQSSRYNETVVVTVSSSSAAAAAAAAADNSSNDVNDVNGTTTKQELLLVPCLDELNGGVIWNDLVAATASTTTSSSTSSSSSSSSSSGGNTNNDIAIIRHLRTKRWFFPMLNDVHRNNLYEQAIAAACREVVQQKKKKKKKKKNQRQQPSNGCNTTTITTTTTTSSSSSNNNTVNNNSHEDNIIRVLDIGSGTGLLAMMVAKHMQQRVVNNKNNNISLSKIAAGEPSSLASASAAAVATVAKPPERQVRITSMEMSSAMSRLAQMTVADNQLQHIITIQDGHSTEQQQDPDIIQQHPPVYDLCVSELLESALLGEGMIPTLRDAWNRTLHFGTTIMIPQRARVYGQLVQGAFLNQFWGPHHHHDYCYNCSLSESNEAQHPLFLRLSKDDPNSVLMNGGTRGGFIMNIHAEYWVKNMTTRNEDAAHNNIKDNNIDDDDDDDESRATPLSDPFQIMQFDVSNPNMIPGSQGRQLPAIQVMPHTSGVCHAILFWWELDLYDNCTYSTRVGQAPWQDHWHQNLFVFTNRTNNIDNDNTPTTEKKHDKSKEPIKTTNATELGGYDVKAGTSCSIVASHDDISLWFSLLASPEDEIEENHSNKRQKQNNDSKTNTQQQQFVPPPPEEERVMQQPLISPFRAFQLNDSKRLQLLQRGIRRALECHTKDCVLLDLSDFGLCAMLAATTEGAKRVSSLESSTSDTNIPNLSARIAQLANELPRPGNMFQILQCHAEQLINAEILGCKPHEKIGVVVAEPYYEILEGWHLQEALNYYYLVRALKARDMLHPKYCSVPSVAVIRGVAIQSHSLSRAYGPCGDDKTKARISGFDHSRANHYGNRFNEYDLSLPMWEYDFEELTKSFEVARLQYTSNNGIEADAGLIIDKTVHVPFKRCGGICNGIMIWIDYGICTSQDTSEMSFLSTRERPHRQLIRLLTSPVKVSKEKRNHYEFICHFQAGGQACLESHSIEMQVAEKSTLNGSERMI